jgi:hypothetical protein
MSLHHNHIDLSKVHSRHAAQYLSAVAVFSLQVLMRSGVVEQRGCLELRTAAAATR